MRSCSLSELITTLHCDTLEPNRFHEPLSFPGGREMRNDSTALVIYFSITIASNVIFIIFIIGFLSEFYMSDNSTMDAADRYLQVSLHLRSSITLLPCKPRFHFIF